MYDDSHGNLWESSYVFSLEAVISVYKRIYFDQFVSIGAGTMNQRKGNNLVVCYSIIKFLSALFYIEKNCF